MAEQMAKVGELDLCYETFGSRDDPAMLLVMGLGTQMLGWHEGFCEQLAQRGFFVIRYDNRDIGRSTHLKGLRPPTIKQLLLRDKTAAHYSLADMADDGIGLLDQLGIERAHVAGASMGGMIAQLMAANHPERVLLARLDHVQHRPPLEGHAGPAHLPDVHAPPARQPRGRDRVDGLDVPDDRLARRSRSTRRSCGASRSSATSAGTTRPGPRASSPRSSPRGDRADDLRRITAPTVVIHGTRDLMVRPSGGRETARAIPGARLVEIDGMGHDLPRAALGPHRRRHRVEHRARGRVNSEHRRRVASGRWPSRSPAPARRRWTGSARSGSRCTITTRRSAASGSARTSTTTPRGPRGARSTPSSSPAAASRCLAERDGALVGYAMVAIKTSAETEFDDTWQSGDRVAEIETLVVLPEARGEGVGSGAARRRRRRARGRRDPGRRDRGVRHQHRRDPALRAARVPPRVALHDPPRRRT